MLSTMSSGPRRITYSLCCGALLGLVGSALADPKPLPKAEQAKVDEAIKKGVAYLKRMQTKEGYWAARPYHDRYLAGQAALCAYALLEAGVAADDPAIHKAASYVRQGILKIPRTYEISLAILFLDRLGDPKDKKLIQSLGLRLIAGQFRTGGWSYDCPIAKEEKETALLKPLEELSKGIEAGESYGEVLAKLDVPSSFKRLTVFQDPQKLNWREVATPAGAKVSIPFVGRTDNSNTQFAILGLWAAQRHGLPMGGTLRLVVERFERTQLIDGGWGYMIGTTKNPNWVDKSMTCVGLLALAVGRGEKFSTGRTPPPGKEDPSVFQGLAALYQRIERPQGWMDARAPYQSVYHLWSVERVGMLFDLPTLGDKEWYRWGAESLVTNQNADGSWPGKAEMPAEVWSLDYGQVLSTAFALLFLKHSHPMKDLTPKLPFKAKELNEGIVRLLQAHTGSPAATTPSSGSRKPDR